MSETGGDTRRILEMVESGRISAAEGARLLESTRSTGSSGGIKCPFCAETVVPNAGICPECNSSIHASPAPPASAGGFHALTGLGKFLVIYTLLITGFWLVSTLFMGGHFFSLTPQTIVGSLLAVLGLTAGIMILKGKPAGWNLGMLWSGLQIIELFVRHQPLNRQVLQLGANFLTNGDGLGINLVGIILLILFIKAKAANQPDARPRY